MGQHEKRRAPRSGHDSVLELFDRTGRKLTGIGRLVNFSNHGACFASVYPFKKGAIVRARLRLLREGVLDISGRIIWTRQHTNLTLYGIKFSAVRPLHRKAA
jgi:hypothetical protein